MSSFIVIVFYIFIGYGVKFFSNTPANLANFLNKFVIYISLPAMILLQIPKLNFDTQVLIPIAVSWSVMSLSALLVFITARYFKFSKNITGSLMLVSVLGNSSFVGIPLITMYFGETVLPYIIVYDQLGTFLALSIYGTIIASYYSYQSEVNLKIIAYKVFTFPPFVTLVIAMFLKDAVFIPLADNLLQLLSAAIIPFALIAVGLQLKFILPKEEIKPFIVSLLIKLLIAPIIAIIVCYIFSWEDTAAKVSVMEAGMPPMITAAAMASMIGLAPRLSNAIVGYGILISFITTFILNKVIT